MTLRITIEVLPGGSEEGKFEVGRIELYNQSNLSSLSDYGVAAADKTSKIATRINRQKRAGGWARLLRAALDQILKDFPRFAEFNG